MDNNQTGSWTATMAAPADGPQLSELESLQLKANQVTDESLESTRRMITLCEDVSPNCNTQTLLSYARIAFVKEKTAEDWWKLLISLNDAGGDVIDLEAWSSLNTRELNLKSSFYLHK